jgi:hypothetical protein
MGWQYNLTAIAKIRKTRFEYGLKSHLPIPMPIVSTYSNLLRSMHCETLTSPSMKYSTRNMKFDRRCQDKTTSIQNRDENIIHMI